MVNVWQLRGDLEGQTGTPGASSESGLPESGPFGKCSPFLEGLQESSLPLPSFWVMPGAAKATRTGTKEAPSENLGVWHSYEMPLSLSALAAYLPGLPVLAGRERGHEEWGEGSCFPPRRVEGRSLSPILLGSSAGLVIKLTENRLTGDKTKFNFMHTGAP